MVIYTDRQSLSPPYSVVDISQIYNKSNFIIIYIVMSAFGFEGLSLSNPSALDQPNQSQLDTSVSATSPRSPQLVLNSKAAETSKFFTEDPITPPGSSKEFGQSFLGDAVKIPTKDSAPKPPCAVIVTLYEDASYDPLFREIQQISPDPERFSVAVFSFHYTKVFEIFSRMNNIAVCHTPEIDDLMASIDQVDPGSVVFNFECCSACGVKTFGATSSSQQILALTALAIKKKYVVIFGDFSLKALISQWHIMSSELGPNPFMEVGECCGPVVLRFDANELKNCANAQLQAVGEMCSEGRAVLNTLSGTIVYTVNPTATDDADAPYTLKILSVVERGGHMSVGNHGLPVVTIGESIQGYAGHVELQYKCGGRLLVSAGHWIELQHLQTREEDVLQTVQNRLGAQVFNEYQTMLNSSNTSEEREVVTQRFASRCVTSSAPCTYVSR